MIASKVIPILPKPVPKRVQDVVVDFTQERRCGDLHLQHETKVGLWHGDDGERRREFRPGSAHYSRNRARGEQARDQESVPTPRAAVPPRRVRRLSLHHQLPTDQLRVRYASECDDAAVRGVRRRLVGQSGRFCRRGRRLVGRLGGVDAVGGRRHPRVLRPHQLRHLARPPRSMILVIIQTNSSKHRPHCSVCTVHSCGIFHLLRKGIGRHLNEQLISISDFSLFRGLGFRVQERKKECRKIDLLKCLSLHSVAEGFAGD